MPTTIEARVMLPDEQGNLTDYSDQVENISVSNSATDKISTFDMSMEHFDQNLNHLSSLDEINIEFREDGGSWQTALNGFIADPEFSMSSSGDTVRISGGDYGKLLQHRSITQSYTEMTVEDIVKDVMEREVPEISVSGVQDTGVVVDRITFNIDTVFDALDKLLKYLDGEWQYYVDSDKVLRFEPRGFTDSGLTFEEGVNISSASFSETDDNMVNFLFIYGKNQKTKERETFTATGSEQTVSLKYKPHNIEVYNKTQDKVLSGGVEGGDSLSDIDTEFLLDFQQKQVTFNEADGDTIQIRYDKSNPVFGFARDQGSISKYGEYKESKTIQGIETEESAKNVARKLIDRYGRPLLKGDVEIEGVNGLDAGTTAGVVIPSQDIDTELVIAEVQYNYSTDGFTQSVQLNERIKTLDDAIADHEDRIKQLEGQASGTNDVASILKFPGEGVEVSESGSAESRDLNDSFVVGRNLLGDHHEFATASDTNTEKGFDRGTLTGSAVISGDKITLSSSNSSGSWKSPLLPYNSVGESINSWESLVWDSVVPTDASVSVNILNSEGQVLASDISSGSDISNIDGTDHMEIQIEVELSSSVSGGSLPEVSMIRQNFQPSVLGDQGGSWSEEAII